MSNPKRYFLAKISGRSPIAYFTFYCSVSYGVAEVGITRSLKGLSYLTTHDLAIRSGAAVEIVEVLWKQFILPVWIQLGFNLFHFVIGKRWITKFFLRMSWQKLCCSSPNTLNMPVPCPTLYILVWEWRPILFKWSCLPVSTLSHVLWACQHRRHLSFRLNQLSQDRLLLR